MLGSPDYQPWIRLYALYQGRFVEGWIPDDFYGQRVLPALNGKKPPVRSPRTLARRLFQTDLFPDAAYCVKGRWFDTDYRPIEPDRLADHVFADGDEVYLKREGSGAGRGIHRLGRDAFAGAVERLAGNHVVQKAIVPHPWFDEIDSMAVPTLRVTTSFLDDQGPRFRASFLRVGYDRRPYVESGRVLRCAVIDAEGTLAPEATDETWWSHARHPDSGFVFGGARIPEFAKARETCLALHARVPHAPLIGWDLVITPAGDVAMMEWNSGFPDIKFSEATVGPVFADCGFERFAATANVRA